MSTPRSFGTVEYYETEIASIKQELDTMPAGTLLKKGAFYYVRDGDSVRGITKNKQIVKQLVRKAYLSRRLENMEYNYSLVKRHILKLKAEDPREIIEELPAVYRSVPASYLYHPSVEGLMDEDITCNPGYQDDLVYRTDSGIYVRSKSELIIANMLDQFGVMFRYEAELQLGGETRFPDFTICKPYDGKQVIWEHLGLMDEEVYRQKALGKLSLYTRCGYLPYNNLICSYERDIHDLSRIEALIEMVLLC